MEQEPMIPVDLDAYRRQLDTLGHKRRAAVIRLELTTGLLKDCVIKAAGAGVSQAECARLAQVPRVTVRDWLGRK